MPDHKISQSIWGDVGDVAAANPCAAVAQQSPATRYAWVVCLLRAANGRDKPADFESVKNRAASLWATAMERHLKEDGCPGNACLRKRGMEVVFLSSLRCFPFKLLII